MITEIQLQSSTGMERYTVQELVLAWHLLPSHSLYVKCLIRTKNSTVNTLQGMGRGAIDVSRIDVVYTGTVRGHVSHVVPKMMKWYLKKGGAKSRPSVRLQGLF